MRIGEQLQVGDGIFDFFALEKRGAADDVVLDVRLAQRFLDGLGLLGGAVQDGNVAQLKALVSN